jgi:hypothetical protein
MDDKTIKEKPKTAKEAQKRLDELMAKWCRIKVEMDYLKECLRLNISLK